MTVFLSVLIAILAFGFLIFTHELGHYISARIFGVTVKEFSLGFGPRMLWYTSKKTGIKYSLAMLPFGGFVSMEGEDEETNDPNALSKKPAWQRLIIMASGAVINLLTGFLLTLILVCNTALGSTVVAEHPESLAGNHSTVGILMEGDRILSVGGEKVTVASELQYAIMRHGNKPVDVVVVRGGEEITLKDVQFPTSEEQGQVFGTTDFTVYRVKKDFATVMQHTFHQCVSTVKMVWDSLFDLITGRFTVEAVSGPIGITGVITDAVGQDGYSIGDRALVLLRLVAMIAINLGVVNLFPLPALDGGRVLFLLIEVIFRRPVPQKVEGMIHAVGIILLFGLMILISVKDIFGFFV